MLVNDFLFICEIVAALTTLKYYVSCILLINDQLYYKKIHSRFFCFNQTKLSRKMLVKNIKMSETLQILKVEAYSGLYRISKIEFFCENN